MSAHIVCSPASLAAASCRYASRKSSHLQTVQRLQHQHPQQKFHCRRIQPVRALFGGKKDGEGGGNPFGNMANLMENVKKAQELVQGKAAKIQEELALATFDGYSSDETVRVVMSGNQEPKSVDITEEAHAQGAERLAELVTEAMRDAHAKSVDGMKTRMRELASSLGLPNPPS